MKASKQKAEASGRPFARLAVPHQIAEQLWRLAMMCRNLAAEIKDKDTANELEGVGAELAEEAMKLKELYWGTGPLPTPLAPF